MPRWAALTLAACLPRAVWAAGQLPQPLPAAEGAESQGRGEDAAVAPRCLPDEASGGGRCAGADSLVQVASGRSRVASFPADAGERGPPAGGGAAAGGAAGVRPGGGVSVASAELLVTDAAVPALGGVWNDTWQGFSLATARLEEPATWAVPAAALAMVLFCLALLCTCGLAGHNGDRRSRPAGDMLQASPRPHHRPALERPGRPGTMPQPGQGGRSSLHLGGMPPSPLGTEGNVACGASGVRVREDLPPPRLAPQALPALCAGLVVPRQQECMLAVQVLPLRQLLRGGLATVDVLDLQGKPVLRAEVGQHDPGRLPSTGRPSATSWVHRGVQGPVISLRTPDGAPAPRPPGRQGGAAGRSVLATCCPGPVLKDGRAQLHIYGDDCELFGSMERDPAQARYVFTHTCGSFQLFFDGIFDANSVFVTNERREQLADAEPCSMSFDPAGKFYRLRCTAGVDVGLVLCGMMAIDWMA